MRNYCNQPDRDSPKLKCGYPLPCPFHTIVIELSQKQMHKINRETDQRVKAIAKAINGGTK
jgi:hypothetical protein